MRLWLMREKEDMWQRSPGWESNLRQPSQGLRPPYLGCATTTPQKCQYFKNKSNINLEVKSTKSRESTKVLSEVFEVCNFAAVGPKSPQSSTTKF